MQPSPSLIFVARAGVALALAATLLPAAAQATALTRARISLDATKSPDPAIGIELTLATDAKKPVSSVDLYLAREVSIASAAQEGQNVPLTPAEVAGTSLRKWTLRLPAPLSSAQTRVINVQLTAQQGNPAIRWNENGGWALPGSGWFPSLSPAIDPTISHFTTLTLPQGMSGIACGNSTSAGGSYAAVSPGRPFFAWGRYEITREKRGVTELAVWRLGGSSPNPPALDLAASLWESLILGLGPACGTGELRLIQTTKDVLAGGQRTLFWDESQFGAKSPAPAAAPTPRDLAAELSASFWTDCLSFDSEHAAWFTRSFQDYFGDVAFVHASRPDRPEKFESEIFQSHRARFSKNRSQDRSLKGLPLHSAAADEVLLSRGTLLVHMLAEATPSRDYWLAFLGELRKRATAPLAVSTLFDALRIRFPNQHEFAPRYLNETVLPDFKVVSHLPRQGTQKDRLRVEVMNSGDIEGSVEVAMLSRSGDVLRTTRLLIPAKEKRAVLFQEEKDADRIVLDPRGVVLQSDFTNDTAQLSGKSGKTQESQSSSFIPSYPFEGMFDQARKAAGLQIALDGVTVSDFNGVVVPYQTSQGVSGASLLGTAKVKITPGGAHAKSWLAAMKRESLSFDASELWIRFPIEKWAEIERQLGERATQSRASLVDRNRPVFEYSFPTYFADENRAQVPPAQSAVVVFTASGGELRGFVRKPEPGGRVMMRFWDQLSGATIWEETH